MNGEPFQVFISYAHEDEGLRAELNAHLAQLRNDGWIRSWDDLEIVAGQDWEKEISSRLEAAEIVLLLISADFLASEFCYHREMKRAIARHDEGVARVVPILLRPCDWETAPFGRLQALPEKARPVTSWANPDEAFTSIARGVRRLVEELRAPFPVPPPVVRRRKYEQRLAYAAAVVAALALALGASYLLSQDRKSESGISAAAAAKQSIRGRFTDHASGAPLAGIRVFFPEQNTETRTNADGLFEIELDVAPDSRVKLLATLDGYRQVDEDPPVGTFLHQWTMRRSQ